MSAMLTARCAASGAAAGGQEHHQVVQQQADFRQSGLVGADVDEGDVDVAGLDGVDQLAAVPGFTQPDLDAGPLGTEGPEEAGRILVPTLGVHPQLALFAGRQCPQVGGGGDDAGGDGSGVGQRNLPAAVSRTGRGPPGRSNSGVPTMRSRVATCWLTADWSRAARRRR